MLIASSILVLTDIPKGRHGHSRENVNKYSHGFGYSAPVAKKKPAQPRRGRGRPPIDEPQDVLIAYRVTRRESKAVERLAKGGESRNHCARRLLRELLGRKRK